MSETREITERYHLGGVIGSAGDLRSLRAIDRATGEAVVVELVPAAAAVDDRRRDRFLAAAAVLAELRHPALPTVLDLGVTHDGNLFLVREADVGRDLGALAGESPAHVLELLVQAVDGLVVLDRHGLHHGALTAAALRIVPGSARPSCRIVDLAHGLAQGIAGAADAADAVDADHRRRDDLQALALLACRLLGATRSAPGSALAVELPLAVSFEIEDAEALRGLLDRGLRRLPLAWEEARSLLAGALWGERRRPPAGGPATPATVRLTFSTEPPEGGLMPLSEWAAPATADRLESTRVVNVEAPGGGDAAAAAASGRDFDETSSVAEETQPVGDMTLPAAGLLPGVAPVPEADPVPALPPSAPPLRGAYAAAPGHRWRRYAVAVLIVLVAAAAALAGLWLTGRL